MSNVFNLTLIAITGDAAEEGPGWYITGTAAGIFLKRKISIKSAEEIGRAFEEFYPSNQEGIHPFELVGKGSQQMKKRVEEELDEAEKAAAAVASLRKNLQEFE